MQLRLLCLRTLNSFHLTTRGSMLIISLIYTLVWFASPAAAQHGVNSEKFEVVSLSPSSAPSSSFSHRRLYGIKRLKVLRPVSQVRPSLPSSYSPVYQSRTLRRQQQRVDSSLPRFVPRAQLPPILQEEQGGSSHVASSAYHSPSNSYHTAAAAYHTPISVVSQQPSPAISPAIQSKPMPRFIGEIDELKRKRIEARWRKLGINFRTIPLPTFIRTNGERQRQYVSNEEIGPSSGERERDPIEQLNVPVVSKRVYPQPRARTEQPERQIHQIYQPIPAETSEPDSRLPPLSQLPEPELFHPLAVLPPASSNDYHSRTTQLPRGFRVSEKLSPRPRLRIRLPGANVEPSQPAPYSNFNNQPQAPLPPPSFGISSFSSAGNSDSGLGFGSTDESFPHPQPQTTFSSQPEPEPEPEPEQEPTITEAPFEESAEAENANENIEKEVTEEADNEPVPKEEPEGDSGIIPGEDSGVGFGAGPSELPPELANVGFAFGGGNGVDFKMPANEDDKGKKNNEAEKPNKTAEKRPPRQKLTPEERRERWWKRHCSRPGKIPKRCNNRNRLKQRKQANRNIDKDATGIVIPQNSGLRPVSPPKEFADGGGFGSFGSGSGSGISFGSFGGGGGSGGGSGNSFGLEPAAGEDNAANIQTEPEGLTTDTSDNEAAGEGEDIFTGDSALTPSRGPTGDGYGSARPARKREPPPMPPPQASSSYGDRNPYGMGEATENSRTTVKPSALLSVLQKADEGFEQAINHFEQETPVESAAIDILEVALGSQKLDSQAKLLGHVDRTIGLDNLQRIQRWANTAGALDLFKEQFLKFAKNFKPPEDLFPTVPPQLEYLFKPTG